ncbi:hypothetical protein FD754_007743 [Muntiacus muntjak]|uniref:Transducer of regulated CREB activity N-terminal domain-containing protein n=1 Tax=Muntiacus muntjak TaxID=9888 RepID=A0A5N3WRR3_MUNMU|nr:hypothetical protein FD754_007743 [Muntiacus muntjak]
MASPSNPLKFSEKITLQKQCEAKELAAFEEAQKLRLAYRRSSHCGGCLPNFLHSPLDSPRSTGNHRLVEQVQRDPRRMSPAFFSPPPASSYMMNPSPLDAYPGLVPARVLLIHRDGFLDGEMDSKKLSSSSRPRSCEDPGINIFWSPEKPATVPVLLPAMNTGGSLPDETACLHLSGGNSPSSVTHLGIRLHSPLSHPSLQSSLSNPNLQASLSGPQPQLQGSHSHRSRLPVSSLAHHALPATSLGHPSLSSRARSTSSLLHLWFCPPHHPPTATPTLLSFCPRGLPPPPPSNARRSQQQLPKQFLPTTSPTLSFRPTNQRLPPYPLQPLQCGSAHPATHPTASAAARAALSGLSVWPSGCQPLGRQMQCGTLYPLSPSEHGQQSYHQSMIQHGEPINQLVQNLAGFSEGPGFLGDERPVSGPQDPHALNHRNITHYCSGPGLSAGFEVPAAGLGLGLEEELRLEPLGLEGLSMLSELCALLPDPAVEDLFHSDRLQ